MGFAIEIGKLVANWYSHYCTLSLSLSFIVISESESGGGSEKGDLAISGMTFKKMQVFNTSRTRSWLVV